MGYYNTFVVRIWCSDHGEMVRGRVQHVGSEEHAYFLNTTNMIDFMTGHLKPPPSELPEEDKMEGWPALLSEYLGDIDG